MCGLVGRVMRVSEGVCWLHCMNWCNGVLLVWVNECIVWVDKWSGEVGIVCGGLWCKAGVVRKW